MNRARIAAIVSREFLELRKNRMLIFTIVFPPLLLTALPLVIMGALGGSMDSGKTSPEDIARYVQAMPQLQGYSLAEILQVVILQQFLTMYLIMPVIIPVTIAASSVIHEKEARSLEPLLATPIRTEELLLGKTIAAVVPAVLTTWLAYAIFFGGARFIAVSGRVFDLLLNPMWLLAMLLLTPCLAVLSVSVGMIISARVNDTRVAQQLAGALVIPIVVVAVAQTAGFVFLNVVTFAVATFVVALIDVGVVYAGIQLFQRETILTRWK